MATAIENLEKMLQKLDEQLVSHAAALLGKAVSEARSPDEGIELAKAKLSLIKARAGICEARGMVRRASAVTKKVGPTETELQEARVHARETVKQAILHLLSQSWMAPTASTKAAHKKAVLEWGLKRLDVTPDEELFADVLLREEATEDSESLQQLEAEWRRVVVGKE